MPDNRDDKSGFPLLGRRGLAAVDFASPKQALADPVVTEPLRRLCERARAGLREKLTTATVICAIVVLAAGLVVWLWGYPRQKDNPGFWHFGLVSMLFWLSITQGMSAVSCILRVAHASWRYPINRMLDMASLFGLWVWALLPFLVVARNRIYVLGASEYRDNVWRLAGPTFYDALAIGTAYVAGWMLLYLTSIPDFALLRDRVDCDMRLRALYARLSTGWHGSHSQWTTLRFAEGILVIGGLVAFTASQTVLGWDFQLASARDWDSSIFAPLYTLGSLLGGLAMSTLVMTAVKRVLGDRSPIRVDHYDNIGKFMIGLGLLWFYFRWCDFLTAWYEHVPAEWQIQNNRITAFPYLAGLMVLGCFVVPVFANMFAPIRKSTAGQCVISLFVLTGIAVQRFLDTVPTFAPNYPVTALTPSFASIVAFAGLTAMFVLTYLIGARFVPIASVWGAVKSRTRSSTWAIGGEHVDVIAVDPPVWET